MTLRHPYLACLLVVGAVALSLVLGGCNEEEGSADRGAEIHRAQATCGGQLKAAVLAQNGKLTKVECK